MSTPTSALARPHPPAIGTVSSSRLDVAALADIATGLAEAEELWRPHVVHDSVERARVRLLASPVYEVWLLGWTPGQSVGLHDHGGANGAFVVVDGTLTETSSAAAGRPHLGSHRARRRRRRPGAGGRRARRRQPLGPQRHEHPRLLSPADVDGVLRVVGARPPGCPRAHLVGRAGADPTARRPPRRPVPPPPRPRRRARPSRRRGRAVSPRIDTLLERARRSLERVSPQDLADEVAAGAVLVDIRPAADRASRGRAARCAS